MISNFMLDFFRAFSLTFPETIKEPNFKKSSFWERKKISSTNDFRTHFACLKLSEEDPDRIFIFQFHAFFLVPNKWKKRRWTLTKIEDLEKAVIKDLTYAAYNQVAPEKLKFPPNSPTLASLKS